jgi:hypothetical protein
MIIFGVIWRVRSGEPSSELAEEEVKDVGECGGGVRRVGRIEAKNVGETAGNKGLDAAVLVKEKGPIDEVSADGIE